MDKDSFSYFVHFVTQSKDGGVLNKLIQPRLIFQEENYLEDEFDIHIADNRIYISCIEKYLKALKI